jgi:hypothetical protein
MFHIFLYIFGASIPSIPAARKVSSYPGDASHRGSGVVDATDSEVSRVGMKLMDFLSFCKSRGKTFYVIQAVLSRFKY